MSPQGIWCDDSFVWFDYLCIPQSDTRKQSLAIASLPHYATSCGIFTSLVPNEGKDKYLARAWCQVEFLCSKVPRKNNSSASAKHALDNANKRFCSIEDGQVLGLAGLEEVRQPNDCDLTNAADRPKIQLLVSFISEEMSNFCVWCEDSERDRTYGNPDEKFMPDEKKLGELRFLLTKINTSGDKVPPTPPLHVYTQTCEPKQVLFLGFGRLMNIDGLRLRLPTLPPTSHMQSVMLF
jgi:hypothetical protein